MGRHFSRVRRFILLAHPRCIWSTPPYSFESVPLAPHCRVGTHMCTCIREFRTAGLRLGQHQAHDVSGCDEQHEILMKFDHQNR